MARARGQHHSVHLAAALLLLAACAGFVSWASGRCPAPSPKRAFRWDNSSLPRARSTTRVLDLAVQEWQSHNAGQLSTSDLLLALIAQGNSPAARLLASAGVTRARLEAQLFEAPGESGPSAGSCPPISSLASRALERASKLASDRGGREVLPEDLLLSLLLQPNSRACTSLERCPTNVESLRESLLRRRNAPLPLGEYRRLALRIVAVLEPLEAGDLCEPSGWITEEQYQAILSRARPDFVTLEKLCEDHPDLRSLGSLAPLEGSMRQFSDRTWVQRGYGVEFLPEARAALAREDAASRTP